MRPVRALPSERIIVFPYCTAGASAELIPEGELKAEFPLAYAYLRQCERTLRQRERGRWDGPAWYGYSRSQALQIIGEPKIVTPDLAPWPSFLLDATGSLCMLGGAAGGYGIVWKDAIDPRVLVAVLNSSCMAFAIDCLGQRMESGYLSFEARFIRDLPIPRSVFKHGGDADIIRSIAAAQSQLEESYEHTIRLTGPRDTIALERKIAGLWRTIDDLVAGAFRLTAAQFGELQSLLSSEFVAAGISRRKAVQ